MEYEFSPEIMKYVTVQNDIFVRVKISNVKRTAKFTDVYETQRILTWNVMSNWQGYWDRVQTWFSPKLGPKMASDALKNNFSHYLCDYTGDTGSVSLLTSLG